MKRRRIEYGTRKSILYTTPTQESLHSSVTDRVIYRLSNSDDYDVDINQELLILITGSTWNLYKVSQLFNLKFTPVKLKQYASHIKQELVNNLDDENQDIHFDVKVFKIPIIKENEECYGLKIEVYLSKETKQNVLKYKSILLSWGEYTTKNNISHLPFLMCMGQINITRLVNTAISQLFDTTIRSLRITEDDLMWLSTILNETNSTKNVSYHYKLTDSKIKSNFVVSFPHKLITNLWNKIHPPEFEEINFNHVQEFHKQIQCQLIVTYGFNFELLKFHTISVDDAMVSCDGKIKIRSFDAVLKILSFINDISILLDTCYPTISNPY